MKARQDYREVYSTDRGAICSGCDKPSANCSCSLDRARQVLGDGNIKVGRESKGRGGKTVTTVSGLPLNRSQLRELLTFLKQAIGTGGAEKGGCLELQGDHIEVVLGELTKRGFKPKRAGG